jgi:hypothetical protein
MRIGETEGEANDAELPAYAAALHPSSRAWASVGRGSKVAVRSIESEGDDALRSPGSVVDTTKGRFGMSVAFVSILLPCLILTPVPRRHPNRRRLREWTRRDPRRRNARRGSDVCSARDGCARFDLEP